METSDDWKWYASLGYPCKPDKGLPVSGLDWLLRAASRWTLNVQYYSWEIEIDRTGNILFNAHDTRPMGKDGEEKAEKGGESDWKQRNVRTDVELHHEFLAMQLWTSRAPL